jgi:bifunctional non-homologous end joining protein LigD
VSLAEYKRKRKFDSTPEPAGGKSHGQQLRFVVQKHAASRLHYDFRLELDGVLKSWAVPKGPSLNPTDKRLAMMVEDHPMDYRLFEGIIPAGNYGAGTVMVWDEGTYTDYDESTDPASRNRNLKAGLAKGDFKIVLHGQKLNGAYVLAKIRKDEKSWLLIKKQDDFSTPADVTTQDRSVLSGRTLDEISQAPEKWLHQPELDLSGSTKAKLPTEIKPMLATLTAEPFDAPDWFYEIKWDGYRIIAYIQGGKVRLQSRGRQDYSRVFEPVGADLANLKTDCVLDGEMVVLDKDGRSDFGALQNYQKTGEGNLVYMVFDVLHADGRDLRKLPLRRRKEVAQQIVQPLNVVQFSDHVESRGVDFFLLAQQRGLEGIMAKAANSLYEEGRRSRSWLKVKTHQRQEAVVGGWTDPRGSRQKIGALVLGVYDESDKLQYIGHTGGGLDDRQLRDMHELLQPLERQTSPFASDFKTNAPVHWIEPKPVVEVSFAEWTNDGHMRQPVFVGLRQDKDPRDVRREKPVELPVPPPVPREPAPKGNSKVTITNRDKVFWPKNKITKGDLVDYYSVVAEVILPHLKGRPESMNRHPNGIDGKSFFQKDLENHPDWVRIEPIFSESNGKDLHWLVCDDRDTLLYMINLGCIELNPWHSRADALDNPDWCLIDLDAKSTPFENVIKTAQASHKVLDELGVESLIKTSGKTGLHICIPLGAKYSYDQSRMFTEILVKRINDRLPAITSVERNPAKRQGKVYLDYLQNRKGQTMAAPYCVRPIPGAPVSTPLKWTEVRKGLDPQSFNLHTTQKRLDKVGDLWQPVLTGGIDMPAILEQLS